MDSNSQHGLDIAPSGRPFKSLANIIHILDSVTPEAIPVAERLENAGLFDVPADLIAQAMVHVRRQQMRRRSKALDALAADSWAARILKFVEGKNRVEVVHIVRELVPREQRHSRSHSMRVGKFLRSQGWTHCRMGHYRGYRRPSA